MWILEMKYIISVFFNMQVIYTHCEIFGKNGKVVRKKKNHLNSNKVIAVNILIYFLASFVYEFLYRWNHNSIFLCWIFI